jgi:carbonic anhydrase
MTQIDELLKHNRELTTTPQPGGLDSRPRRQVAIVTCMDCRIDPVEILGLEPGEAHVLRNAGGVVTDDVIRSLAISQHKLATREVMLIHHSRCGMQTLTDDGFRAELLAATGLAPSFAIESFSDAEEDVRQSMRRVRHSPFIPYRDAVRGFVLDIETLRLHEVELLEDAGG